MQALCADGGVAIFHFRLKEVAFGQVELEARISETLEHLHQRVEVFFWYAASDDDVIDHALNAWQVS